MDENQQEQDSILDEEVAMIFSSDRDSGPSTSTGTRSIPYNMQAGSSRDNGENPQRSVAPPCRSIGSNRRKPWEDTSESDSSSEPSPKVFETVEEFLLSIPRYNDYEHSQIPSYMEVLGDNARHIETDLPESSHYTDEEMEVLKRDYILDQLNFLIREHLRRTAKEEERRNRSEQRRRLSLIKKPLPIRPKKQD